MARVQQSEEDIDNDGQAGPGRNDATTTPGGQASVHWRRRCATLARVRTEANPVSPRLTSPPETYWCFKKPAPDGVVGTDEASDTGVDDGGGGERLVCVRCGARITDSSARVDIDGSHDHYFVNPHGYDFRIGCFAIAPGCVAHGPTSGDFTWFPGHTWQLAHCQSCTLHLGWMFRSPRRHFHGLILARLVEVDESTGDST